MPEEISYEFDDFRLNPIRRLLLRREKSVQLPTKALDLLLALVRGKGKPVSKELLTKEIWGTTFVSDNTFHVTLHAVRKALGDTAEQQRYIQKVSRGYCFVADVREVLANVLSESNAKGLDLKVEQRALSLALATEFAPSNRRFAKATIVHVLVGCSIYAALYAVSVFLEIAYEFDHFSDIAWKIAPLGFAWIMITSVAGLTADRNLTLKGVASGLAASAGTFLLAAAVLFIVVKRWLPPFPITQSTLQSYPAQAAYLKDIAYFIILAFCFLIVPFHFITTAERDIERGQCDQVLALLTGNKLSASPRGTIYPRFWALAAFLVVAGSILARDDIPSA